ncbi:PoNi-like cognate immunity protein [Ralstonia mannitolilytica]|uniref:PoNi-like cognate immunity protein n=1 Tax=Ralstonia mannitolilytica TaxID=105219 RepID=UPI00292F1077|nr:PoNe immunity protein domain-containing protein [Ralstonia mannitolilytica]
MAQKHWHLMLRMYSRGDHVQDLAQHFAPMLDAWEESERLGATVWTEKQQYTRHAWAVNLDHYIVCFWLVGLALALEIPDDQWQRLIALIGNEGEDVLLDRVIASRQSERKIGTKLCHPKPYQRLLDVVNAPQAEQAKLLLTFVDKWYSELDRPPKKGLSEKTAMYDRPYWHRYGDENFEGGAYFGRWCVEAVAAAKAFGMDDSLCLGHPSYPGDLLRPDGPTTHPAPSHQEHPAEMRSDDGAAAKSKSGWLARIFGKQ